MENKRKISAKIVADSIDPRGNRITTFVLTYPRFIHAELLTHRLFSRNAASSRAIPFKKMVEDIENDPFIPIAWQKDHKGMQGVEYITDPVKIDDCIGTWLLAKNKAIREAKDLNNLHGVTKQLCNRLLEPFQWYTCLVTTTELDNFFELRCPKYKLFGLGGNPQKSRKDWLKHMQFSSSLHPSQYPKTEEEWWGISESSAEIHIQALAEAMWDAQNESTPEQLKVGEWHIPFGDKIDYALHKWNFLPNITELWGKDMSEYGIKVSTARCARLSYMTFDGEIDYEKDIKLHDQLIGPPFHASPFEHCCRVMSDEEYYSFIKGEVPTLNDKDGILNYEYYAYSHGRIDKNGYKWINFDGENPNNGNRFGWCNNIRGFIQYRYLLENGNS